MIVIMGLAPLTALAVVPAAAPPTGSSLEAQGPSVPRRISSVRAAFPPVAGTPEPVVLKLTVNADGLVGAINAVSGPRTLIPAATRAAAAWRFQPGADLQEIVVGLATPAPRRRTPATSDDSAPSRRGPPLPPPELRSVDPTTATLPCEVRKAARMLVTIASDGSTVDAIATEGDADLLAPAVQTVLMDLRPPGPPPVAASESRDFVEVATLTCSPPGVFPPLPPMSPRPVRAPGHIKPPVQWLDVQVADAPPVVITLSPDRPQFWLHLTVDGRVELLGRDLKTLNGRAQRPLDPIAAYVITQWLYTPVTAGRFALDGLSAYTLSR